MRQPKFCEFEALPKLEFWQTILCKSFVCIAKFSLIIDNIKQCLDSKRYSQNCLNSGVCSLFAVPFLFFEELFPLIYRISTRSWNTTYFYFFEYV